MLPVLKIDYEPGDADASQGKVIIEVGQIGDGGPDSKNRLGTRRHIEDILRSINNGCDPDEQIVSEEDHCYSIRIHSEYLEATGTSLASIHALGVDYQFKQNSFYPYCHVLSQYWQRLILAWGGPLFLDRKIAHGSCLIEINKNRSVNTHGLGYPNAWGLITDALDEGKLLSLDLQVAGDPGEEKLYINDHRR